MLQKRPITPINSAKKIHYQPHKFKPLQIRLQALLDLYGLSVEEGAKKAGFSHQTLLSWLSPSTSKRYRAISWERFDSFQKALHESMGLLKPCDYK